MCTLYWLLGAIPSDWRRRPVRDVESHGGARGNILTWLLWEIFFLFKMAHSGVLYIF